MKLPLPDPWRYFAKRSDRVLGGWVNAQHLDAVLRDLAGWDVYVTLNPSVGSAVRARLETVVGWRAVLVDLDPAVGASLPARALDDTQAAASELLGFEASPAIIDTGRGMHLWYLFPELSPAPGWAEYAMRSFLGELARKVSQPGWKVDVGVGDLARLARCPGSTNQRTGRVAALVDSGGPDPRIPAALERFRPNLAVREAPPAPEPSSAPWGMFLNRITLKAALFLTEGAESGDRHHAICATVNSLRDYGCSESQIALAIRHGNALCHNPLDEDELYRIFVTTRRSREYRLQAR